MALDVEPLELTAGIERVGVGEEGMNLRGREVGQGGRGLLGGPCGSRRGSRSGCCRGDADARGCGRDGGSDPHRDDCGRGGQQRRAADQPLSATSCSAGGGGAHEQVSASGSSRWVVDGSTHRFSYGSFIGLEKGSLGQLEGILSALARLGHTP